MKILMLGWEYPPAITGGLGIACRGIAESLAIHHSVYLALPKHKTVVSKKNLHLLDLSKIPPNLDKWRIEKTHIWEVMKEEMGSRLIPYLPPEFFKTIQVERQETSVTEETEVSSILQKIPLSGLYGPNMMGELEKYAWIVLQVAEEIKPDIIYAHDWMTVRAIQVLKEHYQVPIVWHVHSTEYDRNGSIENPEVLKLEQLGLHLADKVITVSLKVKNTLTHLYQSENCEIEVVPNGIVPYPKLTKGKSKELVIGFVGRFTHQKSPDRFVDIAREIIIRRQNVRFVMIGDGYLLPDIYEKIRHSGLQKKIEIMGFLNEKKVSDQMLKMNILLMPSASEPFGLVALEALVHGAAVVTTTNAGVTEWIRSIPQIEHWDIFTFTNTLCRLIDDETYRNELVKKGREEVGQLSWKEISLQITKIFESLV